MDPVAQANASIVGSGGMEVDTQLQVLNSERFEVPQKGKKNTTAHFTGVVVGTAPITGWLTPRDTYCSEEKCAHLANRISTFELEWAIPKAQRGRRAIRPSVSF